MFNIKFFSSKYYEFKDSNCGDCIVLLHNHELLVFDCGCEEHAKRVIKIMNDLGIKKAKCVLSHNDSDHFDGFKTLIDEGRVECIYTICALKHVDDIYDKHFNHRNISRDKIKELILEKFDNIKELSGYLKDIYDSNNELIKTQIIPGVSIVAPDYEYAIETIAKAIDTRESDVKDGDSVMNAASVCLKVVNGNESMLLTGDSSFKNIESLLDGLTYIQLPHHGRDDQMIKIRDYYNDSDQEVIYLISDNTGTSNGGCNLTHLNGYACKCTRQDEFEIDLENGAKLKIGNFGDDVL